MSKIDWRQMFKDVCNRMNSAGESREMGARWMAEKASTATFELEQENKRLRAALEPFSLISSEGLVADDVYTTVTTVSDYFHAAFRALSPDTTPQHDQEDGR